MMWTFQSKIIPLLIRLPVVIIFQYTEISNHYGIRCCCSVAKSWLTLCDSMDWSTPDSSVLPCFLGFAQIHVIESLRLSDHFILCCHLLLLPSVFPSIRGFSNESALCIRWPKYWRFNFSISPSNEYSGLNSFRIDWFDLLAVQGTLKSLLQQDSSKASILQRSAFFIVQLSHPYMTTGKTITSWFHHFMANRWENNGTSERLYFGGDPKSL